MEWNWNDRHLASMEDFVEWLCREPGEPMLYRGQGSSAWSLESTLDRRGPKDGNDDERLRIEQNFLDCFRKRAHRFLGPLERKMVGEDPESKTVAGMTVMQHFGAPTRLLDWTTSRAVGAYFACIDFGATDAAIWWTSQKAIEDSVDKLWKEERFERRPKESGGQVILESGIFNKDGKRFVSMAHLPIQFPRAQAQRGCFTIGSRLGLDHREALEEQVSGDHRGRVIIPAKLKQPVIEYLESLAIDAVSLQHAGADIVGLRMANGELDCTGDV